MSTPAIPFTELSPQMQYLLKAKGFKPKITRSRSLTIHEVRTHAIRALATLAHLTNAERTRVLRHMDKLNRL